MAHQYTAVAMDSFSADKDGGEKPYFEDESAISQSSLSTPIKRRPKRLRWIVTAVLVAVLFLFLHGSSAVQRVKPKKPTLIDVSSITLPYRHDQHVASTSEPSTIASTGKAALSAVHNRTLGFERIYVLNMPHRRDKKAELTLLAYHYGLDFTFVDGLYAKKVRPDLEKDPIRQGQFGVAEAHGQVWQRMLDDGVSTALIMEDDVDFSIHIREQMERLREPLGLLTSRLDGRPAYMDLHDPYHSAHWDQLWFGEETEWYWKAENLPENMTTAPMVVYNDPTRSREMKIDYQTVFKGYGLDRHDENDEHASERLRLVQASRNSWALGAYAFTRKGVHKALYMNGHKDWVQHIDFDLMQIARQGTMRDFTVVPPLFQQRKPLEGEDSERTQEFGGGHIIGGKLGRTNSIDNTARQNLEDDLLAYDKPIIFPSQNK